jgi:hypothetical protein
MLGELLTIIVGFFKWMSKGFKTDLKKEIYGYEKDTKNVKGINYLIGILIFIILIVILLIV